MYQPKGSMCMSCKKCYDDCSHLPFKDMRVIERHKDVLIVKCIKFERR